MYGLPGIARLFGCSIPTVCRIKRSGKIDRAVTQIGRKIIVDADLALELAGKKVGGRISTETSLETIIAAPTVSTNSLHKPNQCSAYLSYRVPSLPCNG